MVASYVAQNHTTIRMGCVDRVAEERGKRCCQVLDVTRDADEDSDWTLRYFAKKSLPGSYSLVLRSRVRPRPKRDALESYTIIRSTKPWLLNLSCREDRFSFSAVSSAAVCS